MRQSSIRDAPVGGKKPVTVGIPVLATPNEALGIFEFLVREKDCAIPFATPVKHLAF